MRAILRAVASLIAFRFRSRSSLELEIIALRHQLDVLKRKSRWRRRTDNVRLSRGDRKFWGLFYHFYPRCIDFMILARPRTVIEWHRNLFRRYWRRKTYHGGCGNVITQEVKDLIRLMAQENPLWGASRIYGELRLLGYTISKTSVLKLMRRRRTPPTPGWRAFLRNHIHETVGMDMFVVISATFRLLYGFVLIEHCRRKIVHIAATEHPTSRWLTDQISIAFRHRKPKFVLRDRDALYRNRFSHRLKVMGIRERVIDKQSPWQNAYAEAVIHTLRRECLSQIIQFNAKHLERILHSYVDYYNQVRCHSSLDYDSPDHRPIDPVSNGKIISVKKVGGLHHHYVRKAA